MAELADARDLKSLDRKVVRVQSPLWAPKQNERVTIQIHTRLPFKISPFTLVVAIANANRRGFFFFPPSFLSPPPSAPTNAARDLAQFSARFGTPLTCASIVLAHCMQRARRKISRLSAFRLSELHAYSRYHFWASCSGTSPYSPLSDSKSQIPLFNFFARPI